MSASIKLKKAVWSKASSVEALSQFSGSVEEIKEEHLKEINKIKNTEPSPIKLNEVKGKDARLELISIEFKEDRKKLFEIPLLDLNSYGDELKVVSVNNEGYPLAWYIKDKVLYIRRIVHDIDKDTTVDVLLTSGF